MSGPSRAAIDSALERRDLSPAMRARLVAMRAHQEAGITLTDAEQQHRDAILERVSVELGGPIPARFKHLQHLNQHRQ